MYLNAKLQCTHNTLSTFLKKIMYIKGLHYNMYKVLYMLDNIFIQIYVNHCSYIIIVSGCL